MVYGSPMFEVPTTFFLYVEISARRPRSRPSGGRRRIYSFLALNNSSLYKGADCRRQRHAPGKQVLLFFTFPFHTMRAVSSGKKIRNRIMESTDWSSLMTDAFFSISSSSNGLAVIPSSVISVITALKDSVPFSEQAGHDSASCQAYGKQSDGSRKLHTISLL